MGQLYESAAQELRLPSFLPIDTEVMIRQTNFRLSKAGRRLVLRIQNAPMRRNTFIMRPVHTFSVVPSLPSAIESLRDIAYNLRWCWSHESVELFRRDR